MDYVIFRAALQKALFDGGFFKEWAEIKKLRNEKNEG